MERIILVCGGNKKVIENHTPRSLARLEQSPAIPFWLDLLSPSERLLNRISIPFRFDSHTVSASLSRHRGPSCEDFGHYLFIQTFLLEPSKKNLFIRSDLKIFLSSQYLITIHRRGSPLKRLLPVSGRRAFTHTGTLLLTIFDQSICALLKSLTAEDHDENLLTRGGAAPSSNPLWWRLRNFRAALLGQVRLLHEIGFVGARFFAPEDKTTFGSAKAKISFLCDMTAGLLYRVEEPDKSNLGTEKEMLQ